MNDSFYRDYEDLHRGSRELIKTRLRAYLPFITPLPACIRPASAVDLGCGRGEWLELLGESGFDAFGVDLDEGMLAACRERGLSARHADAIKTLREMPDDSMALVSAFHVVEHMPFGEARALIDEALRVLRPGGLLILETPNPENLVVGASSFYQDPSHERPVPPELLRFAVKHAGFERARVVRLQEAPELRSASSVSLIQVLNGVSPDYSVVAQKAAPADVLAQFDAPFSATFGISLESLAQRYDAHADSQIANVKQLLAESEGRLANTIQHGSEGLALVEQRLLDTEARIAQLDARATEAEARAAQATATLHAMLQSRSWRITAPLRSTVATARRIKAAARENRISSACKRRVKSALLRIGFAILQRPGLTRAALLVLDRVPGVKYRLRNLMRGPSGRPPPQASTNHLSPRAASIYEELKKAMDARNR